MLWLLSARVQERTPPILPRLREIKGGVMAYFSNGSEGECFENECAKCKYGELPCPIALVQFTYNYEACNNPVATKILDRLVSNKGECSMRKMFKKDFNK
jgi:hypothetical protein